MLSNGPPTTTLNKLLLRYLFRVFYVAFSKHESFISMSSWGRIMHFIIPTQPCVAPFGWIAEKKVYFDSSWFPTGESFE
jgi:hypothetical protein